MPHALSQGIAAEGFGRLRRVPKGELTDVIGNLRARGLLDSDGRLSGLGLTTKDEIEVLTDQLAAPAYDTHSMDEIAHLVTDLEPITTILTAVGSR